MDEKTKQQLSELHHRLVQTHLNWPAGKAEWIAKRMLQLI